MAGRRLWANGHAQGRQQPSTGTPSPRREHRDFESDRTRGTPGLRGGRAEVPLSPARTKGPQPTRPIAATSAPLRPSAIPPQAQKQRRLSTSGALYLPPCEAVAPRVARKGELPLGSHQRWDRYQCIRRGELPIPGGITVPDPVRRGARSSQVVWGPDGRWWGTRRGPGGHAGSVGCVWGGPNLGGGCPGCPREGACGLCGSSISAMIRKP